MRHEDAVQMLSVKPGFKNKQTWADLGCGSGVFTKALADILQPGSIIYAVDTDAGSLGAIPSAYNGVIIHQQKADFVQQLLLPGLVDGILMANSLHYVKDKKSFIHKLLSTMLPAGKMLLIEYDTDRPVKTWVPYPVSFNSLKTLFPADEFTVIKLLQRASVYGSVMYSAMITRK